MDHQTQENWEKVKEALEQAGKIDTDFYRRAVALSLGLPDPLLKFERKNFDKKTHKPHEPRPSL